MDDRNHACNNLRLNSQDNEATEQGGQPERRAACFHNPKVSGRRRVTLVVWWDGQTDPLSGTLPAHPTPLTATDIPMVTVGMNYHVLPGKQQDFQDKFAGVIDALKAAPGHTNSTLWKDVADDASYLITSEWNDESAFNEFIRSDAFRAVTNWGKEQILSGRPQHKIYKH
jgi:heme-degrading monooxygenase HmoA